MFIDLSANSEPTRSEERDSSRASPLQNFPAPPNGAGGVLLPIYKHVTRAPREAGCFWLGESPSREGLTNHSYRVLQP